MVAGRSGSQWGARARGDDQGVMQDESKDRAQIWFMGSGGKRWSERVQSEEEMGTGTQMSPSEGQVGEGQG